MNSNQLHNDEVLKWACTYLPRERVMKLDFSDGSLLSELLGNFLPSIKRQTQTILKHKRILNLTQISDHLSLNKIPIRFNIYKVSEESSPDIMKLLFEIKQHFGQNPQHQFPQMKRIEDQIKQAKHGTTSKSPIQQRGNQNSLVIWPLGSQSKKDNKGDITNSNSAQMNNPYLASNQRNNRHQPNNLQAPPILIQQEITPSQVQVPQILNQTPQQRILESPTWSHRESIRQQTEQQEIQKVMSGVEYIISQSPNLHEFKKGLFHMVSIAIEKQEQATFPLLLNVITQVIQPEDEPLRMAGQLLHSFVGGSQQCQQSNIPEITQSVLWQELIQRTQIQQMQMQQLQQMPQLQQIQQLQQIPQIHQPQTCDAQIQCYIPSIVQSGYQTPNKSIHSHSNGSFIQNYIRDSQPHHHSASHQQSATKFSGISDLSPIPSDPSQQVIAQNKQQMQQSFHTINEQSQTPSQFSSHSQNGFTQQNIQNGCSSLQPAVNGSLMKSSPLSYVSAPTEMNQMEQQNQQGYQNQNQQSPNHHGFQEQHYQPTPISHQRQSMIPNHGSGSIFQNADESNPNYISPALQPQFQLRNGQRSSIFQNLFQAQTPQGPQVQEQSQHVNLNSLFEERLVAMNAEKTQLIEMENVHPFQRAQQQENQIDQQNTNDPQNPFMIQSGHFQNEQSRGGSQYK